ncbi:response regulator [Clostridium sp. WB02_MRS01]|uniref:response regulator n=1 Tax=Clostridium sp. WB02_MRS01 TaxID=2605777 RepID=UPI0012B2C37B|nr:response regulator [Clostridium sp. WB02_MRS01]MSS08993.1 response regulator [Clostridium sp. WB02_MRS01]
MKTIMIIDDEPLIRRGLESMIHWEDMDCRLIGQAASGEEGLLKIREWKPDIVFTDIKMPKMDGIAMMKAVANEADPPVFVVLSGYNDFELVRAAMRLGAMDYLMKLNLEEEELIRVVKEASERVTDKRKEPVSVPPSYDFKEHFLKELLRMRQDKEFYRKMEPQSFNLKSGASYRLLVIKLTELPDEQWNQSKLSQNFLINICKEQISEDVEVYEYHLEADTFVLYIESGGVLSKSVLISQCEAMELAIKKYLNQEIRIGISTPHHNAMHLPEAFEEALQSIAFHIGGVNTRIHFYMDLLNTHYLEKQVDHIKSETDLFDAIENFLLQLQKFITQRATREEAVHICYLLITQIYELDSNSKPFFIRWFGKEYTSVRDFSSEVDLAMVSTWVLRLEQGLNSFSQEYMGEIYRYKVKKAKQFILENVYQKVSLNQVAAELEITPGYLSRIFKKVTQQSFSDYIAEIKIEEAKKLLLQDNNRVYEVSSKLGYEDPYYFSKVFKRVTQMTPSEYIARN